MKRKTARQLFFVALFAFYGQVLASPFLSCCNESHSQDSAEETLEETMAPDSHLATMHQHDSMMSRVPAGMPGCDDFDVGVGKRHQHAMNMAGPDCAFFCTVCLAPVSVHLPSPEFQTLQTLTALQVPDYRFYLPPFSLDNPFRPPITA